MEIVDYAVNILSKFGIIGGFTIVFSESMIPILPLSVFVALNMITFGKLAGFLVSWIGTIVGCLVSFSISKKFKKKIDNKYSDNKRINSIKKYINKLNFLNLVIIMAIPFTPAFAINIAAGLSNVDTKKFFFALLIGKASMIYFWGFVGTSLYESITDVSVIIKIAILLIVSYILGLIVNRLIEKNN